MEYFFGWIILALLVGALGSNRKIGFGLAFLWALLLSPLIGFIIAIVSPSLRDEEFKKQLLKKQEEQTNASKTSQEKSVIEQLKDAKGLLDAGVLTPDEFEGIKKKILSSGIVVSDSPKEEEQPTTPPVPCEIATETIADEPQKTNTPPEPYWAFARIITAAILVIVVVVGVLAIISPGNNKEKELRRLEYEARNMTVSEISNTFKRLVEKKSYDSLDYYTSAPSIGSVDYRNLLDTIPGTLSLSYLDEEGGGKNSIKEIEGGCTAIYYALNGNDKLAYIMYVEFCPDTYTKEYKIRRVTHHSAKGSPK